MTEVLEINCIDALEPYRPAWQTLLDQTAAGSFFQSLEWLEVYWRHFGEGQKLRVLIVAAAGRPAGILPLSVMPERTRLGPVRTLTYPLHNWGSFTAPSVPTHRPPWPPDWSTFAGRRPIGTCWSSAGRAKPARSKATRLRP